MAHLTGQNGLSDVTGKRLLKHDWTDCTAKIDHHCVTEVKWETRNKVKKCFITKMYVLLGPVSYTHLTLPTIYSV